MFFFLSKILWIFLSPMTFVSVLLGTGFLFRRYRAGNWALTLGCLIILLFGIFPLGHNTLVLLENAIEKPHKLPESPSGIILLGGFLDLENSVARGQPLLNNNAARLTGFLALAKRYPQARLVFTGGDGNLDKTSSTESEQFDKLLKDIGFDASRIVYEARSRNTYENMMYSQELLQPATDEAWILVTSAYHMPRSLGVFQSGGWRVVPYPEAYLTDGEYKWLPDFDVLGNMSKFHIAVREFLGIIAYTLTDKIKLHDITETFLPSACDTLDLDDTGTGC